MSASKREEIKQRREQDEKKKNMTELESYYIKMKEAEERMVQAEKNYESNEKLKIEKNKEIEKINKEITDAKKDLEKAKLNKEEVDKIQSNIEKLTVFNENLLKLEETYPKINQFELEIKLFDQQVNEFTHETQDITLNIDGINAEIVKVNMLQVGLEKIIDGHKKSSIKNTNTSNRFETNKLKLETYHRDLKISKDKLKKAELSLINSKKDLDNKLQSLQKINDTKAKLERETKADDKNLNTMKSENNNQILDLLKKLSDAKENKTIVSDKNAILLGLNSKLDDLNTEMEVLKNESCDLKSGECKIEKTKSFFKPTKKEEKNKLSLEDYLQFVTVKLNDATSQLEIISKALGISDRDIKNKIDDYRTENSIAKDKTISGETMPEFLIQKNASAKPIPKPRTTSTGVGVAPVAPVAKGPPTIPPPPLPLGGPTTAPVAPVAPVAKGSPTIPPPPLPPKPITSAVQYYITKFKNTNEKNNQLSYEVNQILTLIEDKGDWLYVSTHNKHLEKKGYVFKNAVEIYDRDPFEKQKDKNNYITINENIDANNTKMVFKKDEILICFDCKIQSDNWVNMIKYNDNSIIGFVDIANVKIYNGAIPVAVAPAVTTAPVPVPVPAGAPVPAPALVRAPPTINTFAGSATYDYKRAQNKYKGLNFDTIIVDCPIVFDYDKKDQYEADNGTPSLIDNNNPRNTVNALNNLFYPKKLFVYNQNAELIESDKINLYAYAKKKGIPMNYLGNFNKIIFQILFSDKDPDILRIIGDYDYKILDNMGHNRLKDDIMRRLTDDFNDQNTIGYILPYINLDYNMEYHIIKSMPDNTNKNTIFSALLIDSIPINNSSINVKNHKAFCFLPYENNSMDHSLGKHLEYLYALDNGPFIKVKPGSFIDLKNFMFICIITKKSAAKRMNANANKPVAPVALPVAPPVAPPVDRKFKALFNYQAEADDELTFKENDIFTFIKDYDENWYTVGDINGSEGNVPKAYLEEIQVNTTAKKLLAAHPVAHPVAAVAPPVVRKFKALYDYQARADDELTFKENDIFTFIKDFDENWYTVGDINGSDGNVPKVYLEEIQVNTVDNLREKITSFPPAPPDPAGPHPLPAPPGLHISGATITNSITNSKPLFNQIRKGIKLKSTSNKPNASKNNPVTSLQEEMKKKIALRRASFAPPTGGYRRETHKNIKKKKASIINKHRIYIPKNHKSKKINKKYKSQKNNNNTNTKKKNHKYTKKNKY